ncbi:MAG TPA: TerB family tellurite resistance protein [Rhodothermales bacterium]|nr:TerB family tellurite resistance protein [Rhodothermales bacterium]
MNSETERADWSPLHDLALIYLALAHGTDMEIDTSEQEKMIERLNAWNVDAASARPEKIMDEVMLTYMSDHSREMVEASMVALKESMDRNERVAVLNDLADLASADGLLVPGEIAFIQQLAAFWDMDKELN